MLKNFFLLIFLLIVFCGTSAQINAITDNGKQVVLFDNGTWKYMKDSTSEDIKNDSLKINPLKFSKPKTANFLVKSNIVNIGIYIDPNKWTFSLHRDNEVNPEYRFTLKNGDGYALLVSEKTPIDLESLKEIALINAQKASIDAKIISSEYRIVNNKKILCLKMTGTIKDIRFEYFGYYYSNENGTIQLLTYTSQKVFDNLNKEFEDFLNGLIEIEKK